MKPIEPESAKELPPADPYAVASNIVLRQLSLAPKTRHQLLQKLAKKGTPSEVATAVLDRFTELGYVDDFTYAQMFIRSKTVSKHLSNRALAYELAKCGIDKSTIERALSERSMDDDFQTACALVAKKWRSMSGLDQEVRERRILSALARKGFAANLAMRALSEISQSANL